MKPHFADLLPSPAFAESGSRLARERVAALMSPPHEAHALLARPEVGALLRHVFAHSDYLARLAEMHRPALLRILEAPPADSLAAFCADAREAGEAPDRQTAMRLLRRARAQAALFIALADTGGVWTLEEAMRGLSDFADAAIDSAVRFLLREMLGREPEESGLAVIALGKLGARELNYSSDVDLAFFYDPRSLPGEKAGEVFPGLARNLARMLEERTADGHAFRVDLRLRPDPGATAAAVSLEAAADYYQTLGQNWERAAFIRARPVGGDLAAGRSFLDRLAPFIWRKYLDFAVIEDMHAMQRQMHGGRAAQLEGCDIKRSSGGIREIEFFIQTQQMILGGRDPALRGAGTGAMLERLAEKNWISRRAAKDMHEAYRFLRRVEHRLQMAADEQTHRLPKSAKGFERLARFMNYRAAQPFRDDLAGHLAAVRSHSAQLFAARPSLSGERGSLVFTGGEDDPETLETLAAMGFGDPSAVARAVRGWHTGRLPATRETRARQLLTALMPDLLAALSRAPHPGEAFAHFDRFLAGLSAGVQFFSLLRANPPLLDLIALVCGAAPRLARNLASTPRLLEAMLVRQDPPGEKELRAGLDAALARAADEEARLDAARLQARERRFQIGIGLLRGEIDARQAGRTLSACAQAVIGALHDRLARDFARVHGRIKGGAWGLVALGKLGGEEMRFTSDLDLIALYDMPDHQAASTGAEPLAAPLYYGRFTQKFIHALSVPTAEGSLYQIDMRLRPSGRAGPVAVSCEGFADYQRNKAWVWEHMALTRARVVCGGAAIRRRMAGIIAGILRLPRDPEEVRQGVRSLHARIRAERPNPSPWNLADMPGGMREAEFICQYLQLIHGREHPGILSPHMEEAFAGMARAGLLPERDMRVLTGALDLYRMLGMGMSLCIEGAFEPEKAPRSLRALLARLAGAGDFSRVEARVAAARKKVSGLFEALIGESAA